QTHVWPVLQEAEQWSEQRLLRQAQQCPNPAWASRGRLSRVVARIERVEVLGDTARGGDLRVVGTCGDEPLARFVRVEVVALVGQALDQAATHDHQALMRTVGLVER